jgi:outer membrane immunogenic protein
MRTLLAGVGVLIALATGAAADGPYRYRGAPPPGVSVDWSGWYAGVQIGYGSGDDTVKGIDLASGAVTAGPFEYTADGVLGGFHSGYNFQRGNWVFGYESDSELSSLDGDHTFANGDAFKKDYKYTGSLRARLGYAQDRYLIYATGGLAYARIEMETIDVEPANRIKDTETTFGWTAGAGLALAFSPKLSGRVEYRYTDYGDTSVSGPIFIGDNKYKHENEVHSVRVGLSYKFDCPLFGLLCREAAPPLK